MRLIQVFCFLSNLNFQEQSVTQQETEKKLSNLLSSILPLQDDEKDVWYDVESLFTNILRKKQSATLLNKSTFKKSFRQFVKSWFSEDYWQNLLQNVLLNSIIDF